MQKDGNIMLLVRPHFDRPIINHTKTWEILVVNEHLMVCQGDYVGLECLLM
jgi:hypothetical protein